VTWVQGAALALGAPGLFLVTFLDSSILSLPEIADLLVIWMVTQHKSRFLLYAASATAGSILGCLALYYLGRKGEEALLRKRFTTATIEKTMGAFRRHGVMAVLIPSILPPPAPFKVFVLLAGAAGITPGRFAAAVAIGRGGRYLAEALLALKYGDQAIEFVHNHAAGVSLTAVILLGAAFLGYLLWTKAGRQK